MVWSTPASCRTQTTSACPPGHAYHKAVRPSSPLPFSPSSPIDRKSSRTRTISPPIEADRSAVWPQYPFLLGSAPLMRRVDTISSFPPNTANTQALRYASRYKHGIVTKKIKHSEVLPNPRPSAYHVHHDPVTCSIERSVTRRARWVTRAGSTSR
jgi:hypothetical protein